MRTLPDLQRFQVFQWNKQVALTHIHIMRKEDVEWLVQDISKGNWTNEDVFTAFARENQNGVSSFARLNGFQWMTVNSQNRNRSSINHALSNASGAGNGKKN